MHISLPVFGVQTHLPGLAPRRQRIDWPPAVTCQQRTVPLRKESCWAPHQSQESGLLRILNINSIYGIIIIINNKDLIYKVLTVFKARLFALTASFNTITTWVRQHRHYYAQFKDEITGSKRSNNFPESVPLVRERLETRSPTFWIWGLFSSMLFHCLLNTYNLKNQTK